MFPSAVRRLFVQAASKPPRLASILYRGLFGNSKLAVCPKQLSNLRPKLRIGTRYTSSSAENEEPLPKALDPTEITQQEIFRKESHWETTLPLAFPLVAAGTLLFFTWLAKDEESKPTEWDFREGVSSSIHPRFPTRFVTIDGQKWTLESVSADEDAYYTRFYNESRNASLLVNTLKGTYQTPDKAIETTRSNHLVNTPVVVVRQTENEVIFTIENYDFESRNHFAVGRHIIDHKHGDKVIMLLLNPFARKREQRAAIRMIGAVTVEPPNSPISK